MTSAGTAALARSVIAAGFEGATPEEAPLDALRAFAPGGVILFARNVGAPAQLRALTGALRALASPPPLVAIDQEGGRVARIRDGVAPLPSAMAVGAAGDTALAERLGTLLGRDLARLGISCDFAPVADLALDAANTVIGTRAYGSDPERTAAFAIAFARGLERGGVAAALKHFPGHGATAVDSHVALPRVAAGAAMLRARDLVPFARAIAARAASVVMTAHIVVEAFDREPATLSRAVLSGLLREELGFDGVIATDCMEMDAIARGIGTVRGAVEALAAGADLVLISHRLELARDAAAAIADAVRSGTLPSARLAEAARRVGALRARLATAQPYDGAVDDDAPLEAARRAVTVVAGDPALRKGQPVTVISFEGTIVDHVAGSGGSGAGDAPSLSAALRRRGWKSELMRVPLAPERADVDLLLQQLAQLGEREFVVVTRDAHLEPAQRDAAQRILALVPRTLAVSARSPYDAALGGAAGRAVCIYGDTSLAFEGCADVLTGRSVAVGTLPVAGAENATVR
ncbi:MAG: beta-N-acetylhexosaminidase [Candidatus Eremiobacteraeota bacterium]|nr:beta-N-acetylhexosaminidase [Candidatus Eremiobacteraeota bacterium]